MPCEINFRLYRDGDGRIVDDRIHRSRDDGEPRRIYVSAYPGDRIVGRPRDTRRSIRRATALPVRPAFPTATDGTCFARVAVFVAVDGPLRVEPIENRQSPG